MSAIRDLALAKLLGGGGGANFVKGTITTNTESIYEIDYGQTFDKYLFIIEMTDESKAELISTGNENPKMYSCFGAYPIPSIGESAGTMAMLAERLKASDGSVASAAAGINALTDHSISLINADISKTSFPNGFIHGYSYNYYICEIK